VGDIVEEAKARAHLAHEVEDVQGRRTSIEAIPLAAHIEAQQTADQQPVVPLVQHHRHTPMSMRLHNPANDRQHAIEDLQP